VQAAQQLGISQPRLNSLLRGNINRFSVDSLLNIAVKAGLSFNLEFKEAA
jgi:predicted XRE-type DNA-binding protein